MFGFANLHKLRSECCYQGCKVLVSVCMVSTLRHVPGSHQTNKKEVIRWLISDCYERGCFKAHKFVTKFSTENFESHFQNICYQDHRNFLGCFGKSEYYLNRLRTAIEGRDDVLLDDVSDNSDTNNKIRHS